jgi:uracil-DNA glycosylase family 4
MNCPFKAEGKWCQPEGKGSIGVMIVVDAPGEDEARDGLPLRPYARAGSVLERAFHKVGIPRDSFVVTNVVPLHPPRWIEDTPLENEAILWGMPFLEKQIIAYRPKAIVALGNTATRVLTGLSGPKLGVNHLSGFVMPSLYGPPVLPCFHPWYLRKGKMSHFGVLLRTIKLALQVARLGLKAVEPPVDAPPQGYHLSPNEAEAGEFYYAAKHCAKHIAYDIETPYSTNEEEAEEHEGHIKSIQFSIAPSTGVYFPWRHPYIEIATQILRLPVPKLSWNGWKFDEPTLANAGVLLSGDNHDLMWAWHHMQPDLPRGLQFAAGQMGWPWPWKHLDNAHPAFYGVVDVDILQWMWRNE